MSARRLERLFVLLVAAHSFAIGAGLLFLTDWSVRFGGFGDVSPAFFARQGGIFHFVVATAYLIEHFRYRGVAILVSAKSFAVVFLAAMWVIDPSAWSVPFSAAGDGAMGALALWIHRRASLEPAG